MKKTIFKFLPLALMFPALLARAQNTDQTIYQQLCPPKGSPGYDSRDVGCINISSKDALLNILNQVLGYLRTIFWVVAVGMVIWAAYLYLFGGASEDNAKKAKRVLTGAVIGMVLALLAASIPFLIKNFLGG